MQAASRMAGSNGVTAKNQFFLIDKDVVFYVYPTLLAIVLIDLVRIRGQTKSMNYVWMQGLVTKERKNLDPAASPFAKDPLEIDGLREGANLIEVVNVIELFFV